MHDKIREDLRVLGTDLLEKKDVVSRRNEIVRRLEEKSQVRECIINQLSSQDVDVSLSIAEDIEYQPSWQRQTRRRINNLDL